MHNLKQAIVMAPMLLATCVLAQTTSHVDMAKVESRPMARTVPLPAELAPFLETDIEARVAGYIQRVLVDRGSVVRLGQLLVELSAPEMESQTSAAEAALEQAGADESQAEAQAAATSATFERIQEAARTPGAVAGNELIQAQKQKEASDAVVLSRRATVRTASDHLREAKEMQGYLRVVAPFDGIITDRFVHPGMMVDANGHQPLLKLQQISHLRLIVPVPETYVGMIERGKSVPFHVPARPGRIYVGTIARAANALDPQNRTMMVELDVLNRNGSLAPGMYPTVDWPVASGTDLLFVPATSVVTTTERTFVITSQNGKAHWVDVRKGQTSGEMIAVRGPLVPGQFVVRRATDEIREGNVLR
jgi:membrane fusion protein, multidrug efflux system